LLDALIDQERFSGAPDAYKYIITEIFKMKVSLEDLVTLNLFLIVQHD
jgi:hypothetical protein